MSSTKSGCVPYNWTTASHSNTIEWQGWFVIADIIGLFVVLYFDIVPIEFGMVACVLLLSATQIITVSEMTEGFANSGILSVACLFIVAEALSSTGAIDYFMGKLLGKPKTLGHALTRMMLPSAFVAAWISSTAVLALLIPVVMRWSKTINLPPSQLMLPLCYAIHLGGTITLVGTTTNLVISGLAQQYYCTSMNIFYLTKVGLPVAIYGIGILLFYGPLLLPDAKEYHRRTTAKASGVKKRKPRSSSSSLSLTQAPNSIKERCMNIWHRLQCCISHTNSETISSSRGLEPGVSGTAAHPSPSPAPEEVGEAEMTVVQMTPDEVQLRDDDFIMMGRVPPGSTLAQSNVEDAGLRHLGGLFLFSVQRGRTMFHAVAPTFVLQEGDVLNFAGGAGENFIEFCKARGLVPVVAEDDDGAASPTLASTTMAAAGNDDPLSNFTAQAVVRNNSALIGKSPKEMKFRSTYKASIISISRAGERIEAEKLGVVVLKVGDVLLLVTSANFSWNAPQTKRDLKPRVDGRQVRFILAQKESTMDEVDDMVADESKAGLEGLGKRDYLFGMRVSANRVISGVRPLEGLTVEKAGLRNISGVRVVGLEHEGHVERAVGPDAVLHAGDVVWCVGEREGLSSLRRIPGLEDLDSKQVERLQIAPQHRRLVEVVISLQSDILFKTVRESRFRTRFDAAIVAVQRQGSRLITKIGDIVLEPGDVLILDTGPEFLKRFKNDHNFLIVSEVASSAPPRFDRFYLATAASMAMVIVTAAAGVNLLICVLFAVAIMLVGGVTTRERAHHAVDWKIIITVASAFGLSAAMINTNVGNVIGGGIVNWAVSTGTGELGVLAIILIMTEILCALITAKAGALLMFPIAAAAAAQLHIPANDMLVALMVGSSEFTTPQGHQTNLMVMGPGAYKFKDYQRMGIPFELSLNLFEIFALAMIDNWWISVLVAIAILLIFIGIDHITNSGTKLLLLKDACCVMMGRRKSQFPTSHDSVHNSASSSNNGGGGSTSYLLGSMFGSGQPAKRGSDDLTQASIRSGVAGHGGTGGEEQRNGDGGVSSVINV